MKPRLQIRIGHQITMTPQLQQAIRLLQLSSLELQMEVQQILESNIMLEVAEDDDYETDIEENQDLDLAQNLELQAQEELGNSNSDASSGLDNEVNDEIAVGNITEIPDELAVDSDWEDIYDSSFSSSDASNYNKGKDFLENQEIETETLQRHLLWQLELEHFTDKERIYAIAIIDAIDSDGYLRASFDEIAQSLGIETRVNNKEIEAVLRSIQKFDPIGVGARNLKECLLLQLAEYESNTPFLKEATTIVKKHLSLLGEHDYAQLSKRMKLSSEKLKEAVNLIQSLNPHPGALLESSQTTYIIPDAYVKKVKGLWKVELNSEISPKLRINAHYASLIPKIENREDHTSLKTHLQEARWFIKSLKSRHETLLKVAKCIVKRQSCFLDYGDEAMKPLVLHDIAQELEMHESTISRVTTQKYIHTPKGILELKYFFSSHVATSNGGECSSTAIRAMIKKMVATENSTKPLSDSQIATLLSERGIKVARRTVAKYREAMVIPASNERKRSFV
ncbi:MAG: RNA polymerase factor sigma-54 [Candidatus Parabeggiatoa sp. nov. 3]|nr:MAG: RNA polymerase factor sigma-54 [Gammaproteobacteria bacterium]RKZ62805.1 MAG: RNA polymerase factor sigma-54 [Gammaproteobacteria bacterium]RKZ79451.1 MAG: RNA polymerase factor sigma-54 [Gammaproteobacteria bacterium]